MEFYNNCYKTIESVEDNTKETIEELELAQYEIEDYEKMAKMEDKGIDLKEIMVEMNLTDNRKYFDEKEYEEYKLWRKDLEQAYRNSNIKVKQKFKSFEEYRLNYSQDFNFWFYEKTGIKRFTGGIYTKDAEEAIKKVAEEGITKTFYNELTMLCWYEEDINKEYRKNNSFDDLKAEILSIEDNIIKEEYRNYIIKMMYKYLDENPKKLFKKWYKI